MSISDILVGVNSSALNVPLNHTNWLLDYKINGTKSYVYKDKDILHELYRSAISANDEDIQIDAFNYIASELEYYLGLWLSKNYGFRDLTNLPNCKSISDIIADVDIINRISTSEFKNAFFALDGVASVFATTNGLKIASADDEIMTLLEGSDTFKTAVVLNPDIQTATVSSGTVSVTNAFIPSVTLGVCTETVSYSTSYYRGSVTGIRHGSTTNETFISATNSSSKLEEYTATINKFVKQLTVYQNSNPIKPNATNSIKYIQLDNVV